MTYALLEDDQVIPLPRVVDLDPYMDHIRGRTLPALDDEVAMILSRLFSSSAVPGSQELAYDVQKLAGGGVLSGDGHHTRTEQRCPACQSGIGLGSHSLDDWSRHVFMVNIRDFADAWTLNLKTIMKCCIGFLVPDGRLIPFCVHNTAGYRQQVERKLMTEKVHQS